MDTTCCLLSTRIARQRQSPATRRVPAGGTTMPGTGERRMGELPVPLTPPEAALAAQTPEASRPAETDPPQPMDEIGDGRALARVAPDGTRWCRSCDVTVEATKTSAFCPAHKLERNLSLKRLRRAQKRKERTQARLEARTPPGPAIPPGKVLADSEALFVIATRARDLAVSAARATEFFYALRNQRENVDWLSSLIWRAKHVNSAIESGITNGEVLPRDVAL